MSEDVQHTLTWRGVAAIAARAAFALEREESEADFEVKLVELFALLGDELSRSQDLIAGEAYLDAARDRSSVGGETC